MSTATFVSEQHTAPSAPAKGAHLSIVILSVSALAIALFTVLLLADKLSGTLFVTLLGVVLVGGFAAANADHIKSITVENGRLVIELQERVESAEKRLDETEKAIRKIVAFTPGHFAHLTLTQIAEKHDERYNDGNAHQKRLLQLLLDNGYLEPAADRSSIEFSSALQGIPLHQIARLTPIAEMVLKLRAEQGSPPAPVHDIAG